MQPENFYQQVAPFKDKLYRYALKILRDSYQAEDILQEALIKVWKKSEQFQEIENKEAWCMTIVRNLCLDKLRSNKRRRTVDLADHVKIADHSPSTVDKMEKKEMMDRIKAEIEKLPEKMKTVMHLRDIEGYSYQEISDMTEYTLDQIKVNIYRARQYVRKALLAQKAT